MIEVAKRDETGFPSRRRARSLQPPRVRASSEVFISSRLVSLFPLQSRVSLFLFFFFLAQRKISNPPSLYAVSLTSRWPGFRKQRETQIGEM